MFIQNIIDQMKEAQIKLGFAAETTRLYYPVDTLNTLLKTDFHQAEAVVDYLNAHYAHPAGLGELQYTALGKRVEVSIPPEGAVYVHECVETPPFLYDLICLFMQHHHADVEDIKAVFEKYSKDYVCENYTAGDDFDEVLYFKDASIDPYYYCVKKEMGHTIYHRFTPEDYHRLIG